MSNHYLIDANTNPIASSRINGVRYVTSTSPMVSNFVIRIPTNVVLSSEPNTLTGVTNNKHAALLAYYAGFTNITFDDMTVSPSVNAGLSSGLQVGDRVTTKVAFNGVLRTNAVALGATPAQCVLTWEAADIVNTNPEAGLLTRLYTEASAASFTAEVSFNNGVSFNTVTDGSFFDIPVPDQGSNMILRFTNVSGLPKWLTSWALIF